MKKIEYKTIALDKAPDEKTLNEKGRKGWSLCAAQYLPEEKKTVAVFKREVEQTITEDLVMAFQATIDRITALVREKAKDGEMKVKNKFLTNEATGEKRYITKFTIVDGEACVHLSNSDRKTEFGKSKLSDCSLVELLYLVAAMGW